VDRLVIGAAVLAVVLPVGVGLAAAGAISGDGKPPEAAAIALALATTFLAVTGTWLYYALLESSSRQATLGKMLLGLAVSDLSGARIGFGRATGRLFAKFLSGLVLDAGFVMAAFTERKRALHDYLAGTVVERRRPAGVGAVVAVIAAVLVLGSAGTGILAAIAIPNFMRYQLRAKEAEAPMLLRSLARAEAAYLEREGTYLELEVPSEGDPGTSRLPWNEDDVATAAELGWDVTPPTYFTYRVVVARSDDGRAAYSACAESDLDGDGEIAAWVMFQPLLDAQGEVEVEPPDPPCASDPVTRRPPVYQPGDPLGVPFKLSPKNVF
jgi:uncharacterized RDD family membrane protein YckC/type II secretory pathway pseudopilin PulG